MIRPPSLSKSWDEFWTGDPAFIQPPGVPAKDATEEQRSEYATEIDLYLTKIKAAKETGNWAEVLVPGAVPTKFVLQPVDRNIWREILDRGALPADCSRRIGILTAVALLFRLSLKSISGFDKKVERAPDPQWDGWIMAQPEIVNALDEIDDKIVSEIGGTIYRKLMGISPL